ncbi:hypothetical protein HY04AAS1_0093 [Hydrogenobaculum sp. Y04AAS1]|uniref:hypothetical protein n=1 Tax=Hydrogenobaculum sp. (strain Y04AAS1) TaxID=380749 RepID=UPI00015BCF79|nr:hypothetical protein HY04AAS1_0093 [Hydrogenobaculum sp. Y04AAS1]HCT67273.1 hypothetical protein [Hydrogenobaculum sp.]
MIYLVMVGQHKLRELIYLWTLLNLNNIKCFISYIKNEPYYERTASLYGAKVFIKDSDLDRINVLDIQNSIFLLEKPVNFENINNIYKDILSLL